VYTEDEDTEVRLGWARLRSRAGEYYLGLARKALHEEAQRMTLGPDDAAMVRRTTREQVADVVRRIAGPGSEVEVVYVPGVAE
jgi:hypothetical protein